MQLISAVVRPTRVNDVCDALQAFGFRGLTVIPASGFGKVRGHVELYRGVQSSSGFQDQVKLEIVANDEDVDDVVATICRVAVTGGIGDGKIWVSPVGQVIRIRTGEVGVEAL